MQKERVFVYKQTLQNRSTILVFQGEAREVVDVYQMGNTITLPIKTYFLQENRLILENNVVPPINTLLCHYIVGLPRPTMAGEVSLSLIGRPNNDIAIVERMNGV